MTNRPAELLSIPPGQYQLVLARSNVPQGKRRYQADRLRYVFFTSGRPTEYYGYDYPVTYGHNCAAGGMGVAAYAFFAPFVPEAFSSPGPSTIYFDGNNRRYLIPRVRQKPDLAAMDGANNTFFGGDSPADEDTFPNFFGTSAAAPHAAAIAALVLQAAGGPGTVAPNTMRKLLQASAFPHDLDPYRSSAVAKSLLGPVVMTANGDGSLTSQLEPNFFEIKNKNLGKIASLSLMAPTANPTQTPAGVVFDERLEVGLPFTLGTLRGLSAEDITFAFSEPALAPAAENQWQRLDLTFGSRAFGFADVVRFGVDRDEADAAGALAGAVGGNSADLLGQGVLLPEGTVISGGLMFSGVFANGLHFSGQLQNSIGHGYSPLDGYGFINAERAVELARVLR